VSVVFVPGYAASLERFRSWLHRLVRPHTSFKPIIQGSFGRFSEIAFKAALAAYPGKITCPRSGNDKPCRLDLAVLDDFLALKHEGALASAQFSLDRSRVACDLERVEVLLELDGPAVANRPDVGDLCFAFLSLPVKPEVIVAESHNSLTAVALKDLVRIKDEFVETCR